MKKIIVYEQVKTRRYDLVKGYGDWKNFDGTFEECCQSIEDNYDSNKYIFLSIQVAKFYYDEKTGRELS